MECTHCGAVAQRGRFCFRCGKLLPPSTQPLRRVRPAPRRPADEEMDRRPAEQDASTASAAPQ